MFSNCCTNLRSRNTTIVDSSHDYFTSFYTRETAETVPLDPTWLSGAQIYTSDTYPYIIYTCSHIGGIAPTQRNIFLGRNVAAILFMFLTAIKRYIYIIQKSARNGFYSWAARGDKIKNLKTTDKNRVYRCGTIYIIFLMKCVYTMCIQSASTRRPDVTYFKNDFCVKSLNPPDAPCISR